MPKFATDDFLINNFKINNQQVNIDPVIEIKRKYNNRHDIYNLPDTNNIVLNIEYKQNEENKVIQKTIPIPEIFNSDNHEFIYNTKNYDYIIDNIFRINKDNIILNIEHENDIYNLHVMLNENGKNKKNRFLHKLCYIEFNL